MGTLYYRSRQQLLSNPCTRLASAAVLATHVLVDCRSIGQQALTRDRFNDSDALAQTCKN